jgi:hypothetical protein
MDNESSVSLGLDAPDLAVRLTAVRSRLPGQVRRERIETAALLYGPLYSLTDIRQRVGETLPSRFGYVRGAIIEPIEEYQGRIPDDALLRYDAAFQSGLFSRFLVASPTYYQQRQTDPWIVAEVAGTDQWVVIARWDV